MKYEGSTIYKTISDASGLIQINLFATLTPGLYNIYIST